MSRYISEVCYKSVLVLFLVYFVYFVIELIKMDLDPCMDDNDSDYLDFDLCMDDDELDCLDYSIAIFGSTHSSVLSREKNVSTVFFMVMFRHPQLCCFLYCFLYKFFFFILNINIKNSIWKG